MAQRGYKVANYPLVPDESIPEELFEFPQHRVFGLTIDPQKLSKIRSTRMQTLKMKSTSAYGQIGKIQEEMAWCNALYRKHPQWTILDSTDSGIEENCAKIMMHLDAERSSGKSRNADNPSAI